MQNILFDVYDITGGITVGSSETLIVFDTSRFLSQESTLSSGEMTVKFLPSNILPPENYLLLLNAKITLQISAGNGRSQSKAWIEVDTDSGYNKIPGTEGFMYNRNLAAGWDSVSLCASFQIEKKSRSNFKFRIRAQKTVGTSTLVTTAGASSFLCLMYY